MTNPTTNTDTRSLKRVRLYARTCFWAGVLVSLAANVLHADANIISQAVAAWAPIALLLAVELLSRVPLSTRSTRSWLRMLATGIVAAIAAWVSYWHMVGVAQQYGETGLIPYLLPISVDGLVVIASISLVEVNHRLRTTTTTPTQQPSPDTEPAPVPEPTPTPEPVPAHHPEPAPAPAPQPVHTSALLPRARLIATAHHKATGHTITTADLAHRLSVTEPVAANLLATIHPTTPPPQRHAINGAAYTQEALL